MGLTLSIIVCTYNRALLLENCLDALAYQNDGIADYEIIIVDNNSTDTTRKSAEKYTRMFDNFRLVNEACQGLSHARNRGLKEACGEYVAYIDDDAKARPEWISRIISFTQRHPEIDAFGGPYFRYFTTRNIPSWFPMDFGVNYLGDEERPTAIGEEWISGTNMVFRKKTLETLGGFRTNLGMRGDHIAYGEETELFRKFHEKGFQIYYVPDMTVDHLVAGYKLSLIWLLKASYAQGRCVQKVFKKKYTLLSLITSWITSLLRAFLNMFLLEEMPFKRLMYEVLKPVCIQSGAVIEHLMIRLNKETS